MTILSTITVKQSLLTVVSTIVNGALGAGFYFLLARFLNPNQYGIFAVVIAVITTLSGLADFGSNQSLIKFIPKYGTGRIHQDKIISVVFAIKLLSGLGIILATTIFGSIIAGRILGRPEITSLLPLAGFGVLAQLLFSWSTSLAQAREKYFLWGGLYVLTNSARLLMIGLFFLTGLLDEKISIVSYVSIPMMGFFISLFIFNIRISFQNDFKAIFGKIFKFNRWVSAFVIISAIGAKLDVFLTAKLLNLSSVGVYALAAQVSSLIPQLTSALGAVTGPKYSSFDSTDKNRIFTLKAVLLAFVLAVFSIAVLIPMAILLFKFLGREYFLGFWPLIVLLTAMGISLTVSPIKDSILYFYAKPQFFFWLGVGNIVLTVVSSYILMPRYEIIGSAMVVLFSQIMTALISVGYYFYCGRNHVHV